LEVAEDVEHLAGQLSRLLLGVAVAGQLVLERGALDELLRQVEPRLSAHA
jgi:hypothetical protein